MNQLSSQNNLVPIQSIKIPYLNNCKVRECESTNWSRYKYIRFDVPKECITVLNSQNIGIHGDDVRGYYQFTYNNENSKSSFEKVINAIEAIDKITEDENIKVSAINKHTQEVVMKMLKDLGISKSRYTYPSGRSKKKDWVASSWVFEISSAFPSYTGNISETKKRMIESFDKLYKADQDKRKAEEQEKNTEIQRKESERQLAFLLAKYNLEITCDWDALLRSIIGRNKYLYLAHYLEKNREDWNDGYDYAETGLAEFAVETSQDQEIYNEIKSIIDECSDGVDGRYFRDCTWNYDVLFDIAKKDQPELFADYEKVKEHVGDY